MEAVLKRLDEASIDGDINELKEILKEDPLLLDRSLTMERDNPLHIAALRGHAEFTSEILELKPELASRLNREGMTPLHLAAARGHLQVVQILVDKVVKEICLAPDRKEGLMAVHIAILNGKNDVAEMLIEKYRELLEKTTEKTETLLHLAVRTNNLDFIRYLVDKGVNLNEKDADENTCLHLAVANRNIQVITYLLDQEGVEVNSTNAMGLTPLDVLLVSSLSSTVDTSLIYTISRAGGVGNKELNDLESNTNNSLMFCTPSRHRLPKWPKNRATENIQSEAQTLLVVATLVATMTFQAISNPPGGFIQPPFDQTDYTDLNSANSSSWVDNWKNMNIYPAGQPVLLWELNNFYVLDSLALFSSISVILRLLIALPKTKFMMKILVAVVWFSAFCSALAFGSVLRALGGNFPIYLGGEIVGYPKISGNIGDFRVWILSLLLAWYFVYLFMGLWASVRAIRFLWQKTGIKIKLPNWIANVHWPKESMWFKRIACFAFMLCVVAVFVSATYVVGLLFSHML